jgi:hypothetical protein
MVLKHCAPLSGRNWFIFIERAANDTMNYGVFTYFRLPTAIPLHEAITINPNQFCILVRKTSPNTIEIRGAKGSVLTLIFSTTREAIQSITPIEKFTRACCARIDDEATRKGFNVYFTRVIEEALTLSHGTILICGHDLDLAAISEMQDAVLVSPSLDFQSAFLEFQTANTAGSILALQRCEELLHGFLRCDGMIAFDTSGRITAYRVFFRPVAASTETQVMGGARRRAFEGVKGLVGNQLLSALFRSHDGLTLEHGS